MDKILRSNFRCRLIKLITTYLVLIEFEVHTEKHEASFFLLIYGPSVKLVPVGHELRGKTRIHILQYDRENKVVKIFVISRKDVL